ncbi:caspase, EACC1-associated type [Amycolatopsis sp. MEPSY49]|uniref:caspase, EACC1-associated type n=1 Tax=Amycolatopsis sp. MEPSY49 TaxID=3151600 RepID=UPI003EF680F0
MTDLSGDGVRVLLLATATHDNPDLLPSVPAVARSYVDLGRAFAERCGVRPDRLRMVLDPPDARTMAEVVAEAARQAETVLLVYFIGHGLMLPTGDELYLAARSTAELVPGLAEHQALSFSALQQALAASRASSVVVVLDCCFSGKPRLRDGLSVPAFTGVEAAHGRYLIGSAEQLALAPRDAAHTAFTGAFLDVLEHGDRRGPGSLTLDAVYDAVFRKLAEQSRPWPRRQAGDRSGNLIIAPNAAAPAEPPVPEDDSSAPARCPYLGLDAFGPDDAAVFFGRERMTERVLAAVAEHAGAGPVAVVGPSGSGKTSLLNAGLLAGLRAGGLPGIPGSAAWPCVRVTPGPAPLRRLASAFDAGPATVESLWQEPERVATALAAGRVVLVDQLEELFTLCPDATERTAFLRAVTAMARQVRAAVVLALRADFYGRAADHPELLEALRDRQVLVEPMTPRELRDTIERPAAAAELALDGGLADVILHELGEPAGALPLLSHALWATWRERAGSRLTVAGYRATGGIAEAIATTAERVYTALDDNARDATRRVLPRLVRVGDDTADTARPVDRATLLRGLPDTGAAQRAIDRFTEARLLTHDSDTTRISHEVLLRAWHRLAEWVDADREWLRARQQLAADAAAWERAARDPSLLYRGNRLAAVRERADNATAGAGELVPEAADFLATSWQHERRGLRRVRLAVALLAVFALLAAGGAFWAVSANNETQHQLRLANSRALAEDSARVQRINPRAALQLAQSAWHTAPTPEAYGALFTQYTRLQHADRVFQDIWHDNLRRIMTGPDGGMTVAVNDGGLPTTWTGLNGDAPRPDVDRSQPHELTGGTFELSPSATKLGYANDTGTVALWDLEHHTPIVMLRDTVRPTEAVRSMAFSADEKTLLIRRSGYDGKETTLEAWDLVRRTTLPVAASLGPQGVDTDSAIPGPVPGTIVIGKSGGAARVHDLATGREVRSFPENGSTGHVARNGTTLVQCQESQDHPLTEGVLTVTDIASGVLLRTIDVPECRNFELDTSTNYALITELDPTDLGGTGQLLLANLATGTKHRLYTPPLDLSTGSLSTEKFSDRTAVYAGRDGQPEVLIGDKNLLYRLRPIKPVERVADPGSSQAISPRADVDITFGRPDRLLLNDLRTRAPLATTTRGQLCWGTCGEGRPIDFTSDGKHLVAVWGDELVTYAVPSLTVEARVPLPMPDLGGPPTDDGDYPAWSSSIAPVTDDQVTVLHGGLITRWRPADGTQIGSPTQVRTDRDGLRRSAHAAVLEARWQHPGQAVVVEPSGDVELWDLDRHEIISRLGRAENRQGSVGFTDDGAVASVRDPDGGIQLWDVDAAGTARARGRPIPSGGSLLGFTPDGKLLVTKSTGIPGSGTVQLWDQSVGKQLAELRWPAISPIWGLDGRTLMLFGGDDVQRLELDPDQWFTTLCGLNDRPFADDERVILNQLGAPEDRPCG